MSTDRAGNKEKGSASPGQAMSGRKPRRRQWYEAAGVAIVLIIATAGGYYGFYVTKRTDQLSDYYSRSLAAAAAIVQQVVNGAWSNVCNTKFNGQRLAMIAGMEVLPASRRKGEERQDDPPMADEVEEATVQEIASSCRQTSSLKTIAGWDQGVAKLKFTDGVHATQIPLLTLLEPALPASDFESVLLARKTGEVLFSIGGQGLNIVTLTIDGGPSSSGVGASPVGAASNTEPRGLYTTVTDFDIAGTSYKLFAQPVRVPINLHWGGLLASDVDTTHGDGPVTEEVWVLVGLKKSGGFLTEAMAISPTILLVAFGAAVITLLSLPYLKLRFLGAREALRANDVLVLTSALLIGTTIATFTALEIHARRNLGAVIDNRLTTISADISAAFHEEVACLDDQLVRLTAERADNGTPIATRLLWRDSQESPLKTYPFIEMVYWIKEDGWQANKWTVRDSTTTLIPLDTRDYFIAARDLRFEATDAAKCELAASLPDPDPLAYTPPGYFLESIHSRTTGELNTVLSKRVRAPVSMEDEVISTADNERIVVAAALAPLLSVTEPTLPPGFEFAIIEMDGDVVLHSDSTRNLRENFFDELDDDLQVRAAVWSRATKPIGIPSAPRLTDAGSGSLEPIDIEYRSRRYRANLRRLDGTAWTLVSLYDVSTYRIARTEVLTFALALSLIYTILLIVLFAVLSAARAGRGGVNRSVFHWLWPSSEKADAYVGILMFTIAASLAWFLVQIIASRAVSVLLSVLLGLVTFLVCFETFRRAATGHDQNPLAGIGERIIGRLASTTDLHRSDRSPTDKSHELPGYLQNRLYTLTVMAFIVVLSVLPPISFYRAANDEIMELVTMVDQLRWADELHARSDRTVQRYHEVSMNSGSHDAISQHLFPPSGNLDKSWDIHTAGWRVCIGEDCTANWYSTGDIRDARADRNGDGESNACGVHEDDRCLAQPIVATFGPELLGIVRESWEIRSIANEENRRWHRHGKNIVFVDQTFDSKPGLGKRNDRARLRQPLDDAGLYLASPWLGLAFPGADFPGWAWLVVLVAAGGGALWVMIKSMARLIFLTELKQPTFLPVREWTDLDGYQRALVLRSSLKNEPRADRKAVFRIDAAQKLELTDAEGQEMTPDVARSVTVIVDRFHVGLWDPDIAQQRLALLERLTALDCRVIIHSEVNPLHYLTMVAGDNFRGVTSAVPDLGCWSAVLSEFVRCRDVPLEKPETDDLYARLIETRKEACGLDAVGETDHTALQRLATECWPNDHLEKIAMDLARRKDLRKLLVEGDDEPLVKQVLDLAEAHYRMLWSISGKDERMVLYRLASNGFASWRGRELVRRLLHRGLIYLDPGPTLMNESFRQFVLGAELPEVFQLWTEEEGVSPWARLRMPVIVLVIGIFMFLFATQPQLFSQSLAFTTAIAAIVPTFIKLVSIVGGSRSGSEG